MSFLPFSPIIGCLRSFLNEPSTYNYVADDFTIPLKRPHFYTHVLGSCNGLCPILLAGRQDVYLCNPSTNKYKKLPKIFSEPEQFHISSHGFGFVEFDDDYKLLVVLCVMNRPYSYVVKVYSLNTDSWKIIEDFKEADDLDKCGKFVNGKLHWILDSDPDGDLDSDSDFKIISFDLRSEVQGTIEQPDIVKGCSFAEVGVLGGCLCLLRDYGTHADYWIFTESGVKSWTKVATFSNLRYLKYPMPLCILEEAKILFIDRWNWKVIFYDSETGKYTYRQMSEHNCNSKKVEVYIPSLVSPFPYGIDEHTSPDGIEDYTFSDGKTYIRGEYKEKEKLKRWEHRRWGKERHNRGAISRKK